MSLRDSVRLLFILGYDSVSTCNLNEIFRQSVEVSPKNGVLHPFSWPFSINEVHAAILHLRNAAVRNFRAFSLIVGNHFVRALAVQAVISGAATPLFPNW